MVYSFHKLYQTVNIKKYAIIIMTNVFTILIKQQKCKDSAMSSFMAVFSISLIPFMHEVQLLSMVKIYLCDMPSIPFNVLL